MIGSSASGQRLSFGLRLPAKLANSASEMAIQQHQPKAGLILHSDKGSEFANALYAQTPDRASPPCFVRSGLTQVSRMSINSMYWRNWATLMSYPPRLAEKTGWQMGCQPVVICHEQSGLSASRMVL